ncbi:MAG: alpha/beta hydrolase [Thermoleophilaceae bacterium]
MSSVTLPQGTVHYAESGSGRPLVFVHGLLVNGSLWRKVVPLLEGDFRCIVPELPLGSHRSALTDPDAASPPGVAKLVADFIAALELEDVVLVGNDTGGAISQIVAADHPERLGALVLTPCDAYENFLPPAFRPLQWLAHVPGALTGILQGMRIGAIRRSPLGYGMLLKRPDPQVLEGWARPSLEDPAVRRDAVSFLKRIDKRYTLEAAEKLKSFPHPVLLAWAPEDRFFKLKFAERLAADIPDARLERVEDSRTFMSEDQPERLAELIAAFARAPQGQPASSG